MTTIEDTLTYIDGSKANGRLVVGWKPFTVGNVNAAGGELEWQIVEGAVSISLYANTGAQPTGSYYVVKYELENGAVYLEQWIVPDLPTVNLGQVRVAFPPSPSVMISPLQLTSLGAAPGMFLMWNGQRWVPGYPGTFSFVDPTLVKGDMIVRGDVAPATRLGVGLDGWTLIADSSQPLGIKWIAPVSGFADPTTTKGDLIVRSIAGTTRLGVAATNGWVLTADSTDATFGVKWKVVPLSLPAGSTGYVQWNNAGVFGASANLFWDNTNARLGIGTTSPTGLLETSRPHDTGWNLRLTLSGIGAAGQGGGMDFYDSTNANQMAVIQTTAEASYGACLQFWTKVSSGGPGVCSEKMRITAAGNIGIGTTGPQSSLHIASAAGSPSVTYHATASLNLEIAGGIELAFGGTNANPWPFWIQSRGSGNSANPLCLNPLGGNVGIATINPNARLSITTAGSWVPPSTAGMAGIGLTVSGSFGGGIGMIDGTNMVGMWGQSGDWYFGNGTTSGALTGRVVINSNGRVGIGIGAAGYALDVAGDVNSSTVFRVQGLPTSRIISYLNQTGARGADTTSIYQNNTGAPIFVAAHVSLNASQFMHLRTDLNNPPTNIISAYTNTFTNSAGGSVSGWVMPGHYYRVYNSGGSLVTWFEWN